jgi:hypothetical protein
MSDTTRVLAEVDLCEKVGKAVITSAGPGITSKDDLPGFELIISDSNTQDSTFDCETKAIDPK